MTCTANASQLGCPEPGVESSTQGDDATLRPYWVVLAGGYSKRSRRDLNRLLKTFRVRRITIQDVGNGVVMIRGAQPEIDSAISFVKSIKPVA